MQKVIGIGETLLDIIFKDGQPIGAYPGGSTFNCIVSLSRAGIETTLVSETSNDRVGRYILDFLHNNGVNAANVNVLPESKSPLSLAFLNEKNDAEYIFYKDKGQQDHPEFGLPDVQANDIVIFGSYFAVNPATRPQVVALLDYLRSKGAIIFYDVNFRPSHKNEVMKITPNLLENLEYADFVRGSIDDFEVLYRQHDPDKIYNAEISFYCKKFICTQGAGNVELRADNKFQRSYPTPHTETVSTIGAGDNFNAGFIFGLIEQGITRNDLDKGLTPEQWDAVMATAQAFSANCCQSLYNYVTPEFGEEMKNRLFKSDIQ